MKSSFESVAKPCASTAIRIAGFFFLCLVSLGQTPDDWVNAHNKYRSSLVGYDGKPTSSPNLTWSNTLAKDSQEWADQMAMNGLFNHRPQLGPDSRPYGENLAVANGQSGGTTAVDDWVNKEKAFFDPVNSRCTAGNVCGHYTQVISRIAMELGCGNATSADGTVYTVCNYSASGNLQQADGSFADLYPNQRLIPGGAVFQSLNRRLQLSLIFNECLLARAATIASTPGPRGPIDLPAECGFTKARNYDSGSPVAGETGLPGYAGGAEDAGGIAVEFYFSGRVTGISGAIVVPSTNPLRAVLVTGEN